MQAIGIQAIPKQSFTVVLANVLYDIALIETAGCMSMNLTRGGEVILSGQRVVAGQLCIPYKLVENKFGNFFFLTENGDLPDYEQFGKTQTFWYVSNEEIEAIRG